MEIMSVDTINDLNNICILMQLSDFIIAIINCTGSSSTTGMYEWFSIKITNKYVHYYNWDTTSKFEPKLISRKKKKILKDIEF